MGFAVGQNVQLPPGGQEGAAEHKAQSGNVLLSGAEFGRLAQEVEDKDLVNMHVHVRKPHPRSSVQD